MRSAAGATEGELNFLPRHTRKVHFYFCHHHNHRRNHRMMCPSYLYNNINIRGCAFSVVRLRADSSLCYATNARILIFLRFEYGFGAISEILWTRRMDREGETVQILYIYSHSVRGTGRFAKLFMYYDGRDRVRGKIDATRLAGGREGNEGANIFIIIIIIPTTGG